MSYVIKDDAGQYWNDEDYCWVNERQHATRYHTFDIACDEVSYGVSGAAAIVKLKPKTPAAPTGYKIESDEGLYLGAVSLVDGGFEHSWTASPDRAFVFKKEEIAHKLASAIEADDSSLLCEVVDA